MTRDPAARLLGSEKEQQLPRELDVRGLDLSFRSFDGARVLRLLGSGVIARGASFRRAYLDEPLLDGACFASAALDDIFVFEGAFGGTDFTGASLQRAQLLSCLAPEACFDGADLRAAKLDGTIFPGASLRGANLQGASLAGCSLRDCDLTGADFHGAMLDDLVLDGATLTRSVGLQR